MRLEEMPLFRMPDAFEKPIRMPSVLEVKQFAIALDVRFPENYISFIVKYAGYIVARDVGYAVVAQSFNGIRYAWLHDIGYFLHYDVELDPENSVQNNRLFYVEEFSVRDFVPFTSTSVGGEIGFDFSESRTQPKIVNSNIHSSVPDDDDLILRPVASSFDEFIDKLITKREFDAKYGSMVI